MARYGYGVSTCRTAYQKDHYFCRTTYSPGTLGYWEESISFVHSRKQIERMTPDDLEGQLMVRMFVL